MENTNMKIRIQKEQNAMLGRLLFRMLPVQVAIIAMGSINSIIDGVVAARFIDSSTVGVIGLYYAMLYILDASGSVLITGVNVLSGRHLGSGSIDKTRGVASLGLALALIIGSFLTIVSLVFPGAIADLLGADNQLREALSTYIRGYAIGIIPLLLGKIFASMLQLERREKLGHLAIAVMIVSNVVLDILFVVIWNMGVWGLALATSTANIAYFVVVMSYFLTEKAQLRPSLKLIQWKETFPLVKIGFPGALLVACLAARSLVINRLLLSCSGSDGLSALSSFSMVSGLILSMTIGSGILLSMLSSVFIGEDNRESLLGLIRLYNTCIMALSIVIAVLVVILSPVFAGIFYPDSSTQVFHLTKQLFIIYGCGVPIIMACKIFSSYYQAAGHLLFVNFLSILDGFLSCVIPAVVLGPLMGATGVWLAFLIGLFITLAVSILYPILRLKRVPRSLDEWLLLPPEFGSAEHLVLPVHGMDDVVSTSERVQEFCDAHSLPHSMGSHSGLCLEEMAGNVVQHGFRKDNRKHDIEVRVVLKDDNVILRIKDDCKPFNPDERKEMLMHSDDPFKNVGIRLCYGIADEVEYQNLLGLNVLTIKIRKKYNFHREQ